MASDKKRVLVLCTGNSCRSQMAEGWVNHLLGGQWEARSAGTAPAARVHPLAVRAMAEVGVDIAARQARARGRLPRRSRGTWWSPSATRRRRPARRSRAGREAPRLLLRPRGGRGHRRREAGRLPPCPRRDPRPAGAGGPRPGLRAVWLTPAGRKSLRLAPMAAADTLARTLGARLREERHRIGMSLRELGAASGLSTTTVHQIESGRGSPSLATLQALASTLGVPLGALFESQATADAPAILLPAGRAAAGVHPARLAGAARLGPPGPARPWRAPDARAGSATPGRTR